MALWPLSRWPNTGSRTLHPLPRYPATPSFIARASCLSSAPHTHVGPAGPESRETHARDEALVPGSPWSLVGLIVHSFIHSFIRSFTHSADPCPGPTRAGVLRGRGEGGGQVNVVPSLVGSAPLQLRTEVATAQPSEATEPVSVHPPSLSTVPHVPPTIHTPTLKNLTLRTKNFLAKGKR